jgi:transposase
MDIHEIVRLKRAGRANAEISRLVGCRRKTVRKYVKWAGEQGLLEGDPLPVDELHQLLEATMPTQQPPRQESSLAKYSDEIQALRKKKVELAAIRHRLEEKHKVPVSYEALRRLVRRMEGPTTEVFVRVEVAPGEQAQVDFGYAGITLDEQDRRRRTWAFVMTLSHSRHQYVELVYDQAVETWLACHVHAFEFFGGVPAVVMPDNLKAAIIRACREDPLVQRAYRELAEHYGFRINPHPPGEPHIKGKVEQGGVHYFKRNFMAGREVEPTTALNAKALVWCVETAGERVHGTTRKRPLEVFEAVERQALLPLPKASYDLAVWKSVTLYRDCYVNFDSAYYSAPFRLVDQELWLRGGLRKVRIYTTNHELVATHDRATEPGQRITNPDHLPPHKLPGVTLSREGCRAKAGAIGPSTAEVVNTLLESRPVDKLRNAHRVLELASRYSPERLERACARALHFGEGEYSTIAGALKAGTDAEPLPGVEPEPPVNTRVYRFVRHVGEVVAALGG